MSKTLSHKRKGIKTYLSDFLFAWQCGKIKKKHLPYFNEQFNLFTFHWKMPGAREISFSMPLGTHSGHCPLLVTLSHTQPRTEIEKRKVPQKLWRNLAEWKYLHISAGLYIRVWEYMNESAFCLALPILAVLWSSPSSRLDFGFFGTPAAGLGYLLVDKRSRFLSIYWYWKILRHTSRGDFQEVQRSNRKWHFDADHENFSHRQRVQKISPPPGVNTDLIGNRFDRISEDIIESCARVAQ